MMGYEQLMANLRQFNPDVIAQRAGGNQQREREIRAQQMGSTPAEAGAGITPPYIISNLGSPNLNESVSVYWRMWRNYSLLIKDKFRLFKIYDELARARVVGTNSSLPGTKLKKLELSDLRPPRLNFKLQECSYQYAIHILHHPNAMDYQMQQMRSRRVTNIQEMDDLEKNFLPILADFLRGIPCMIRQPLVARLNHYPSLRYYDQDEFQQHLREKHQDAPSGGSVVELWKMMNTGGDPPPPLGRDAQHPPPFPQPRSLHPQ